MQIYEMNRKNLPAEILVLKEITRQIVSAKQYKRFRRHILIISGKKHAGYGLYHPSGWKYGKPAIILGIGHFGDWHWNENLGKTVCHKEPDSQITDLRIISTHIHELGHMVQHNNKNISLAKRHHNKTFHNLLGRLQKNFDNKVKPKLPEIISTFKSAESLKQNHLEERITEKKKLSMHKNSPEGKLKTTQLAIKRWEAKLKRCQTRLKKLRRREKIYQNTIQKKMCSSSNPSTIRLTAVPAVA